MTESHPVPPPSLHSGEGSSFLSSAPPNDTVHFESVVGIKPGDSGVVIGYQVDGFTSSWSIECFIAGSPIYPGFTGKVSILTPFSLKPCCEDYCFLDQVAQDFDDGLNSILTKSIDTPELDTSFDQADVMPSSVSSGFHAQYCF